MVKGRATYFSLSPSHLDMRSEDDMARKVDLASVATALARYDFPVPGGWMMNEEIQEIRIERCSSCSKI